MTTTTSRRAFMSGSLRFALGAGAIAAVPMVAAAGEDDWVVRTPADVGIDPAALQSILGDARSLPALRSVLVVRNGALIAEHYQGGASMDGLQAVNSATKSVASMLVGIALEQGRIKSVAQTIDELLPAANDLLSGTPVHAMTLEQILTGTSGLRYDFRTQMRDLDTADDPVAFALGLGIGANGPGRWRYNDAAVSLLSPILRHANGGMPVEEIAQRDLFGPLDIERFDARRDKAGNVLAYRGLRLRARDMAKLAWTMADGGRWGARQVVPATWVADSARMHVRTDWSVRPIRPTGYGCLWFTGELNGQPVAWAWGYGAQFALIAPALQLAIVTTASNPRPADLGAQNDAVMGIVARIVALA